MLKKIKPNKKLLYILAPIIFIGLFTALDLWETGNYKIKLESLRPKQEEVKEEEKQEGEVKGTATGIPPSPPSTPLSTLGDLALKVSESVAEIKDTISEIIDTLEQPSRDTPITALTLDQILALPADQIVKRISALKPHFSALEKPRFRILTLLSKDDLFSRIAVYDGRGERADVSVSAEEVVVGVGGIGNIGATATEKEIILAFPSAFRPGRYTLRIDLGQGRNIEQDFTWGVLAINTNKSIYLPNEAAKLSIGVLDEMGMMVCDARLILNIVNPNNNLTTLSTDAGTITVNPECHTKYLTLVPDYETEYKVNGVGTYEMALTAQTGNGTYTIIDTFEVRASIPFEVERITATRIYPFNEYPVTFKIKANQNFSGTIQEIVPADFWILPARASVVPHSSVTTQDTLKTINWNIELTAGETTQIGYIYDAPNISPYFYLLGPLRFISGQNQVFEEARQWQIASDNPGQFGRPNQDITTGGWTTTPLWEKLAETTPDDTTTQITTGSNPTNDMFEVKLSSVTDPGVDTGHIVRHRVKKTGGKSCTADPDLYQLTTLISSGVTVAPTTSYLTFSWTLTEAEAGNITDYTDLRVRYTGNCSGGGTPTTIQATWIELEVPDVTGGTINISGKIYGTDESTFIGNPPCDNSAQVLSIKVNGTGTTTTSCTNGGAGADYQFTNISVNAGDTVTIYLNSNSTPKANLAMVVNNVNVTNADLYQDRIIVRDEPDGTVTNADMSDWDNDDDSTNMLFTANTNTLDTDAGTELHVWTGDTYAPGGNVTLSGSYHNTGTATWSTYTTTFDSTSTGNNVYGTLNGSSAFYKVNFNGSGGGWTIKDPMRVSAANATDTFQVTQGTVTLGDGTGDNLEVNGKMVVGSASGAATFQTMSGLSQGSTIYIDINNNTTPADCANCIISLGTSTNGDPTGTFTLNKNAILRFNSYSSVQSGLEVLASGKLNVAGTQDDTGTDTDTDDATKRETKICADEAWNNDDHNNKHVRMTSGLAFGRIYTITDTIASDSECATDTHDSIVRSDTSSATDTNPTVSGGSCSGSGSCTITTSTSLITSSDQGIGRYIHNITDNEYYLIVDSTEGGAADTIVITTGEPDTFTNMGSGDDIEITDGVRVNDTFAIIDFAQITAQAGTSCNDTENGYIFLNADSETIVQYAEICDLAAQTVNRYGQIQVGGNISNYDSNEGLTIQYSYFHDSGARWLSVDSAVLTSAVIEESYNVGGPWHGLAFAGKNVSIKNNRIQNTGQDAILHSNTSSQNNVIRGNYLDNAGESCLEIWDNAHNSIFMENKMFGCDIGGIYVQNSASGNEHIFYKNKVFGNTTWGYVLEGGDNSYYAGDEVFANTEDGKQVRDLTGIIEVKSQYGVKAANTTTDIDFDDSTGASQVTCYGCTLGSSTEIPAADVSATNAYFASFKHDGTGGSSKIWGEYPIPDDVAETPNDEGTRQFNYANAIYSDSFSPHVYSGSGAEDLNLAFSFNGGSLGESNDYYLYRVTCKNASGCNDVSPSNDWDVFRDEVDVGDATTESQYTDPTTNVQFTIDDVTTDYSRGDTYSFIVWKNANDTNTQKSTTLMQTGDSLTVGTGETIQLLGGSAANQTLIQKNTGITSYALSVTGTINANYYKITGTDNSGLNIGTDATVTNLNNGVFDDTGGTLAGNSRYITVVATVLNEGAKTWNGLTFDGGTADSNIQYNVYLSGTPSSCSNSWTFRSTGNKGGATNGEVNDYDVDGNCGGVGYLLWQDLGIDISGKIYQGDETTFIGSPPCNGSLQAVSVRVNGGSETTTTCTNGGAGADYQFTGVSATAGNTVTIYLNSNSTPKANLVMVAASASVTNANLFQDTVIVRDEQGGTINIPDMFYYDNTQNPTDMLYDAVDDLTDTLTTDPGVELHIWTEDTLDPNGTVTTAGSGGRLHVDDNATGYLDSNSNAIADDIVVDTGATLNVAANVTVGSSTVTNSGSVSVTGTYSQTANTTTVQSSDNATTPTLGGTGSTTFYNLDLGPSTPDNLTYTFTTSGNITVSNVLTIQDAGAADTHTLSASDDTLTLSGITIPFVIDTNATFTASTSTVSYTGNGATNVTATTYYTLSIGNGLTSTKTYTALGSIIVNNQLNLQSAGLDGNNTFDMSTYNLTVGSSSVTNSGSITVPTLSTFTQSASGTTTVQSSDNATTPTLGGAGSTTFYNLNIGPASPDNFTYEFNAAGNFTVSSVLAIQDAGVADTHTFDAVSYTITLSGTGSPFVIDSNASFTASTSTISYTGNGATNVTAATYYTLSIGTNNSTNIEYTAAGNIIANNQVNLQSAAASYTNTLNMSIYNLTVGSSSVTNSGSITVPTRAAFTQSASGTTTVQSSDNSTAPTLGGAGTTTFYNLNIGTTSDALTYTFDLAGNITVSNNLTLTDPGFGDNHILDAMSSNVTVGSSSATDSGSIVVSLRSTFTQSASGTTTVRSSDNSTAPTIGGAGFTTFFNLSIGTTSDALTYTFDLAGNIDVLNNLTLTNPGAGDTHTFDALSYNVIVGSSYTTDSGSIIVPSNTTFTQSSPGTTIVVSTDNSTVPTIGGAGSTTFFNLTIGSSDDAATYTFDLAGNITVLNEIFTNNPGIGDNHILDALSYDITVGSSSATNSGDIIVNSNTTFTQSASGTTTVQSSDNSTAPALGGAGTTTFYNLNIGTTSDALTYTFDLAGNITVSNNLTLTDPGAGDTHTLDALSYDVTVGSSSVTNSGSIAVPTRATFTQSASGTTTVQSSDNSTAPTLGGAGTTTFYNLNIGTTSDALTYTFDLAGNITVSNNLTLTDPGAGDTHTLDALSYDVTVGNFWDTNSGSIAVPTRATFTQSASGTTTVQSSDNSTTPTIGGAGSTTFYNLDIGPATPDELTYTIKTSGDIIVSSNLTLQDADNVAGDDSHTLDVNTNDNAVTITGSLFIEEYTTYSASSNTAYPLTIGDDFTRNGTFTHNSGKIIFNNVAYASTLTYVSATTFGSFEVSTAGKQMQFDNDAQTNIAGTLTLQGTNCTTGRVFLDSDVNDQIWEVNATGSVDIDYVDVEDSNAITALTANDSTEDNDNNTGWTINMLSCAPVRVNIRGGTQLQGGSRLK